MKGRDYKQFAQGTYHHVYNRGNGKQDIFLDTEDFIFFMMRLIEILYPETLKDNGKVLTRKDGETMPRREPLPSGSFDLVAYCLMPNHYHILIRQNTEIPVSTLMLKLTTSYSKYFNKKYNHTGHLFQDRFKAVTVDSDEYLMWLSAYIHYNPKAAKLVKNLKDYKWSSYHEYMGTAKKNICKRGVLGVFEKPLEYEKFIMSSIETMHMDGNFSKLLHDHDGPVFKRRTTKVDSMYF